MKLLLALTAVLLLAIAATTSVPGRPDTAGSTFSKLDAEGQPFLDAFNENVGKVRLVMYLSPTCGGCLRGAEKMQEEVLNIIGSDDFATYVVWAPKNGASVRHVSDVTGLVTDKRARQYWDGHGVVKGHYDDVFALAGPCAGIFIVYDGDVEWSASEPPRPAFWQDAHANQRGRRENPRFDTEEMVAKVKSLLRQS